MRIQGPQGPRSAEPAKRSDKATGSGEAGAFARLLDAGETGGPVATSGPRPLSSIDPLLTVQAVGDEGANRRRARRRATEILDRLDDMRHALLVGDLSESHLNNIQQVIAEQRDGVTDPAMLAVLDEIDLLAAVEVAKLEVARDDALAARQLKV